MRAWLAALMSLAATSATASPLALYDTKADTTQLAPLPAAPGCDGFAVACSAAPVAPKKTRLPFDYGLEVSGAVGGGRGRAFSGESVAGWIKAKDVPLSVYFEVQRFQPIGK